MILMLVSAAPERTSVEAGAGDVAGKGSGGATCWDGGGWAVVAIPVRCTGAYRFLSTPSRSVAFVFFTL